MEDELRSGGLGLGLGWRPELASFALRRNDLGFVEVVAESITAEHPTPLLLEALMRRGVPVVPHGIRLSLGSAEPIDPARIARLAECAERLNAPLVSEHIAFVRAGGLEAGQLLPLPRTCDALDVLVTNVQAVQRDLPAPVALEPIAALLEWPGAEMDEAAFLTELVERTDAWLLLDLANIYANCLNHGRRDPEEFLDRIPLERVAYVHMAGGAERRGLYHDTHRHPVPSEVIGLLASLTARRRPPGVMLERDGDYPPEDILAAELDLIAGTAFGGMSVQANAGQ